MTTSGINPRLHAIELGELYWEHDRLALRSLTPAQRTAQLRARERLVRHARRVQDLVEAGQVAAGDPSQRQAADGIVDLMQMLWEHARDEAGESPTPVSSARVPIPAPTAIWAATTPPPAPSAPRNVLRQSTTAQAVCRRCAHPLVRDPLAQVLNRPKTQGWRHVDGRKTHHPDPIDLGEPDRM